MRILVNGQQAFGKAVLERLLATDDEVVGVYCGPDRDGGPVDPIKAYAEEQGIPVFQPRSFRKPEVWQEMRSLEPDLGVMAYVTLFVPEDALNIPRLGTIQYHPSLLPAIGPSSSASRRRGCPFSGPTTALIRAPSCSRKPWTSARKTPSVPSTSITFSPWGSMR